MEGLSFEKNTCTEGHEYSLDHYPPFSLIWPGQLGGTDKVLVAVCNFWRL